MEKEQFKKFEKEVMQELQELYNGQLVQKHDDILDQYLRFGIKEGILWSCETILNKYQKFTGDRYEIKIDLTNETMEINDEYDDESCTTVTRREKCFSFTERQMALILIKQGYNYLCRLQSGDLYATQNVPMKVDGDWIVKDGKCRLAIEKDSCFNNYFCSVNNTDENPLYLFDVLDLRK